MEYGGDSNIMTVKGLITELEKYDMDLPVCINDCMGFVEATEETIKVEHKKYICFPFSDCDEFNYINLKNNEINV